jgi:hypothetical protein
MGSFIVLVVLARRKQKLEMGRADVFPACAIYFERAARPITNKDSDTRYYCHLANI